MVKYKIRLVEHENNLTIIYVVLDEATNDVVPVSFEGIVKPTDSEIAAQVRVILEQRKLIKSKIAALNTTDLIGKEIEVD